VRRALGHDRGFLKTVSRRGNRFVAEVTRADEEGEGTAQVAATIEALAHERERRTNLPAVTSLLLDREAELAEVVRLTAAHRLVTLTGAGGIGKTRLAIEAARYLQSQLPDGAWLVELGPLTVPDLVWVTVATALRLTLPADADLTANDVIDSISNLASKSMIAATLSGALVRYRLLETTRAHALEKQVIGRRRCTWP
jgi:hypothetical protein